MSQGIKNTQYQFPGQVDFYRGKVRDVYIFEHTICGGSH